MLAEMDNSLPKTHSPFRFTLGMLFYATALVAAAMGAFGVVFGILIGGVGIIFLLVPASRALIVIFGIYFVGLVPLFLVRDPLERDKWQWYDAAQYLNYIASAVAAYAEEHGSLPPACIRDADGKPMHSWRVLILPYLDERGLYETYNFQEPWDGPNNRQLIAQMPWILKPRSRNAPVGHTSCLAIVGQRTAWRDPEGTPWKYPASVGTGILGVGV